MRRQFLLLVCLLLAACKKEISCEDCLPEIPVGIADATIVYTGPIGADGCDWLISQGTKVYRPKNLAAEFQQTNLAVKVEFTPTGEVFVCGFPGANIPVVYIDKIEKK